MLLKEQVLKSLTELPENCTAEDIIEKIIFIDKVEKGLIQAENQQTISDEELGKELDKW